MLMECSKLRLLIPAQMSLTVYLATLGRIGAVGRNVEVYGPVHVRPAARAQWLAINAPIFSGAGAAHDMGCRRAFQEDIRKPAMICCT